MTDEQRFFAACLAIIGIVLIALSPCMCLLSFLVMLK
jgi:hypothetical protein